ncbi:MAG: hypothetical protein M1351_01475 [Candidatus Thermoplasmatota archaeon]|nr:hypothetical protein [Candidatus Thermoplasmatota archaeon]
MKKIEKLTEKLKKLRSTPMMLASSDKTAEVGGVSSSRTFYRRPRHTDRKRGGQPRQPPFPVRSDSGPDTPPGSLTDRNSGARAAQSRTFRRSAFCGGSVIRRQMDGSNSLRRRA